MKAGTVLRVGIYLIGLWALYSGLTSLVYFGHAMLSQQSPALADIASHQPAIFGNAVVPLTFSLMCFGYGGLITRTLLGAAADEVAGPSLGGRLPVKVGVKLLALYLLGVFAGPLVATLFELAAVRSGNRVFSEVQVLSDLIANGLGVAFAFWLGLRTDRVTRIFFETA